MLFTIFKGIQYMLIHPEGQKFQQTWKTELQTESKKY